MGDGLSDLVLVGHGCSAKRASVRGRRGRADLLHSSFLAGWLTGFDVLAFTLSSRGELRFLDPFYGHTTLRVDLDQGGDSLSLSRSFLEGRLANERCYAVTTITIVSY